MNGSLYLLVRISTVYIEALKELSHVYSPEGLNTTLLNKAESFQTVPTMGTVGTTYSTGQERGRGACDCLEPASGSTYHHILFMISSYSF